MNHFLDGDPFRYPGLSLQYRLLKNGPLGIAVMLVLSGGEGYFRSGDVMRHMTRLIQDGGTFDSQQYTEIGRWDRRNDDVISPTPVADDAFYAWADPGFWDYDPPLVTYTKAEFMTLFEDCCRNFVAAHPERREEFAAALAANGMSLTPTIERP
ncbi:MAG: hypothetical protein QM749_15360 [Aquabacterium sp.]